MTYVRINMDLAHRGLTPDFTSRFFFGEGMNCVSYDIPYACTTFGVVCVFPLGYSSDPERLEPVL